jgi:hypothetical protein
MALPVQDTPCGLLDTAKTATYTDASGTSASLLFPDALLSTATTLPNPEAFFSAAGVLREFGLWTTTGSPTGPILLAANKNVTSGLRLVQFLSGGGQAAEAKKLLSTKDYSTYESTLLGSAAGIVKDYFKVTAKGGVATYTYAFGEPLITDTKLWNADDLTTIVASSHTATSIIGNLMNDGVLLKPTEIFATGDTASMYTDISQANLQNAAASGTGYITATGVLTITSTTSGTFLSGMTLSWSTSSGVLSGSSNSWNVTFSPTAAVGSSASPVAITGTATNATSLFEIYALENIEGKLTDAQRTTKNTLECKNLRFFGAFFIEYCYYRSRYSALLDLYFNVFTVATYAAPTVTNLFSTTGDTKYTGTASTTMSQADYLKVIAYHLACLNTRLVDMRRLLIQINKMYGSYYKKLQDAINGTSGVSGSTTSVFNSLTALQLSATDTNKYLEEADYRQGVMDYASEKNRYANILLGVYAFLNLSALAVVVYSM